MAIKTLYAVEFKCDGEWRFHAAYETVQEANAFAEALLKCSDEVQDSRVNKYKRGARVIAPFVPPRCCYCGGKHNNAVCQQKD